MSYKRASFLVPFCCKFEQRVADDNNVCYTVGAVLPTSAQRQLSLLFAPPPCSHRLIDPHACPKYHYLLLSAYICCPRSTDANPRSAPACSADAACSTRSKTSWPEGNVKNAVTSAADKAGDTADQAAKDAAAKIAAVAVDAKAKDEQAAKDAAVAAATRTRHPR